MANVEFEEFHSKNKAFIQWLYLPTNCTEVQFVTHFDQINSFAGFCHLE